MQCGASRLVNAEIPNPDRTFFITSTIAIEMLYRINQP
jgi:hypothetical protein